jgi:protein TonB
MSYANRRQMSSNRTVAIVFVALLHVLLGYALITGLAYNVIKKAAEDLKTFDVEDEPPPPPEEPPPPPEEVPQTEPPPVAPPPLVRTNVAPPPPIQSVDTAPPRVINPIPAPVSIQPPPPPPPPPPPRVQQAAKARGSLIGLFSTDDYPASAARDEAQGTAVASISVGTDGRVTGCSITRSTGNSALDQATCNILRRRARFTPAKDQNGQPVADTVTSPPIRWQLVDE